VKVTNSLLAANLYLLFDIINVLLCYYVTIDIHIRVNLELGKYYKSSSLSDKVKSISEVTLSFFMY